MKKRAAMSISSVSTVVQKIRLTKWTASNPVTKKLGLGLDDSIEKLSTAAQLYEGEVAPLSVTPAEFRDLLIKISSNECLSYGIPTESNVHQVLSRERFAEAGSPSGFMTRTADKLVWPTGPGILMVDYDPPNEIALTQSELLEAIYSICPELKDSAHIWAASTSSCLYRGDTGEEVRGITGQRIYIVIASGTDIPRAGLVLFKRSWLAGYGHIKISKAGSLLVRAIIDNCVWQTNRIDYVAPPICVPPLTSRKPEPELLGKPTSFLDTKMALPDLSADEEASYQAMVQSAKASMAGEAADVRERYIAARVDKLVRGGDSRADAEVTIRAALETSVLHAGFVLEMTDGTLVTVAEVLKNKEKYHAQTFADPLEPDYHDDKRIARARLLGVTTPFIHSYAHGGHTYRLAFQRETVRAHKGQRGEYVPKIAHILDTNDLVFARGGSLISINNDGTLMLRQKISLLALIDQSVYFEQMTRNGWEATDAKPVWGDLLSGGYITQFRQVNAVLTAPSIVPTDGRIINMAGYDAKQKVFVLNADQFKAIPPQPTLDDVRKAFQALWYPVSQFPYCDPIDQTVAFTALLTAAVRKFLPTAPGFGFDAPVQGSGKTLLLKVLCILTGDTPTISPQPEVAPEISAGG